MRTSWTSLMLLIAGIVFVLAIVTMAALSSN
jgi:hypothetical protein